MARFLSRPPGGTRNIVALASRPPAHHHRRRRCISTSPARCSSDDIADDKPRIPTHNAGTLLNERDHRNDLVSSRGEYHFSPNLWSEGRDSPDKPSPLALIAPASNSDAIDAEEIRRHRQTQHHHQRQSRHQRQRHQLTHQLAQDRLRIISDVAREVAPETSRITGYRPPKLLAGRGLVDDSQAKLEIGLGTAHLTALERARQRKQMAREEEKAEEKAEETRGAEDAEGSLPNPSPENIGQGFVSFASLFGPGPLLPPTLPGKEGTGPLHVRPPPPKPVRSMAFNRSRVWEKPPFTYARIRDTKRHPEGQREVGFRSIFRSIKPAPRTLEADEVSSIYIRLQISTRRVEMQLDGSLMLAQENANLALKLTESLMERPPSDDAVETDGHKMDEHKMDEYKIDKLIELLTKDNLNLQTTLCKMFDNGAFDLLLFAILDTADKGQLDRLPYYVCKCIRHFKGFWYNTRVGWDDLALLSRSLRRRLIHRLIWRTHKAFFKGEESSSSSSSSPGVTSPTEHVDEDSPAPLPPPPPSSSSSSSPQSSSLTKKSQTDRRRYLLAEADRLIQMADVAAVSAAIHGLEVDALNIWAEVDWITDPTRIWGSNINPAQLLADGAELARELEDEIEIAVFRLVAAGIHDVSPRGRA